MVRVGQGFDVHRLAAGRRLVLGGTEIPCELGLDGHSDADVVLHALSDAILGAVAAGDIGKWFPPDDEAYRDADSAALLKTVVESDSLRNWRLANVDVTVIAEKPKLSPYIRQIRESIGRILMLELDCVSVKATTTEGLGALGRGEGIGALAVVLLQTIE